MSFETWLEGLRQDALAKGISAATLDSALLGIKPIPKVIELDRKQPEFTLTFDQYMDKVVPDARIQKGQARYDENRDLLRDIAAKYGVQPRFIVAFWGIESDFGRTLGTFDVVPALATLAYDGRRSKFFRDELMHALTIIDQGHVTADNMKGSWAGAMGQVQFIPSSFVRFAVDYDGDGRKDIWGSVNDALASAANYLSRSGWKGDETWGRAVRLPQGFDQSLQGADNARPLDAWQALGVRSADGSDLPDRPLKAMLILPANAPAPAFLGYDNYQTILKWNRSHFFALAVGRLAEGIGER
ncbi:MAG: lytic transglycosylase domain-containing protein [Alphaproteobacteria bacterium]